MVENKPFRMSDLERITGLKRRTIHYYLQEGLLSPPKRTGKTMAYYGTKHVEELMRIAELRKRGYSIALIREEMEAGRPVPKRSGDNTGTKSDRKRQLITEAVNVFARKGYNQTKISDITSAVGVGQSTFYIYFPSKKALFIECMDQVFDAMFKDVWEEIKNEKNPIQRLRKRYEVVMKSHPQFIDMLQVLRMAVEDDPRLDTKRREIYASVYDTVKHDIKGAVETGLIHPKPSERDIELMSHIFVGFLETANFILTMYPHYSEDELIDALLEISRFDLGEPEPASR
jgi:AcrR family transcriptional regulator